MPGFDHELQVRLFHNQPELAPLMLSDTIGFPVPDFARKYVGQGREEGREERRTQGLAQGREEGLEAGLAKATCEDVLRLLAPCQSGLARDGAALEDGASQGGGESS